MSDQKGFTVFELITVTCIIAVLAATAVVSFKPMWQKHRLTLSRRQIAEQIQLLRMKSILEHLTYEMKISNGSLYYRQKPQSGWKQWRTHLLDKSISYTMSGSIYFDSKGFVTPKTIGFHLGEYSQVLVININGRVRFHEGS